MLPGSHLIRITYGPGLLGSPNHVADSLVTAAFLTHFTWSGATTSTAFGSTSARPTDAAANRPPKIQNALVLISIPPRIATRSRATLELDVLETCRVSDLDPALEVLHGLTGDQHTLALERAVQLRAALRHLQRVQRALAEALAPVRRERAVDRARARILVDTGRRCEEAHDAIGARTRRRRDDHHVELAQRAEI